MKIEDIKVGEYCFVYKGGDDLKALKCSIIAKSDSHCVVENCAGYWAVSYTQIISLCPPRKKFLGIF